MDVLSYAIFGSIFAVVAFTVFTSLIWAAFSDGREEQMFRTRG
jgi:hypothetical protein